MGGSGGLNGGEGHQYGADGGSGGGRDGGKNGGGGGIGDGYGVLMQSHLLTSPLPCAQQRRARAWPRAQESTGEKARVAVLTGCTYSSYADDGRQAARGQGHLRRFEAALITGS